MALSLAVLLATTASTVSRAAGTAANYPTAKLTTISARGDGRGATLVIEASEPVPYVATRPDPLTVLIDFRNVEPGAVASSLGAKPNGPITSVAVEAAESMGSPVSRVRVALAQPVAHHVRAERNRVLVDFDKTAAPQAAVTSAVSVASSAPTVQSSVDPVAALRLSGPATTTPSAQPAAAAQNASVTPNILAGQAASQPGSTAGQKRNYSGNPVSLDFQQADLRAVLRVFAEISGLNIVIDPAVKGTVDVALRDVPWDQALDIILRANKLGYTVDGTVVRIAPLTTLSEEENQRRSSTTRHWPANCGCSPVSPATPRPRNCRRCSPRASSRVAAPCRSIRARTRSSSATRSRNHQRQRRRLPPWIPRSRRLRSRRASFRTTAARSRCAGRDGSGRSGVGQLDEPGVPEQRLHQRRNRRDARAPRASSPRSTGVRPRAPWPVRRSAPSTAPSISTSH
ncbi:MAG: secretin and TonB N-terminal domain-containing protein [Vicinamibacterales bacterium]